MRTYATSSTYAKTADVFWREIYAGWGILSPYARVRTHDVIFPPYHVTSGARWGGGITTAALEVSLGHFFACALVLRRSLSVVFIKLSEYFFVLLANSRTTLVYIKYLLF